MDAGAAAVEVAHDVALEFFGRHIFDLHDWLEQDGLGFFQAVLEREDRGHFERHFVRVHIVVGAIDDIHMDIDHRVAGDDAVEDGFLESFFHSGDVFLRNRATNDLVLDREAFAALVGSDLADDMAVLTAAAGLLDEFALAVGWREDGFLVSDLRLAGVRLDLELAHEAVADDFEVEFAHAGDDGLAGVFVRENAEGRVFLSEALESVGHLFLIDLGLRLDGHRDNGIRERRRLEEHGVILVAEGVARGDVFDAHDRGDVTGVAGIDILALVGLNLDQAADALALVCARIVNGVALGELAGVNTEENEFADERIAPEFERKRAELAVVVRNNLDGFAVIGVLAFGGRNVERAGEVVHDRIDEQLNALVFKGGSADHGNEAVGDGLAADGGLEILNGNRFFLEEHHADLFIEVAHFLDEFVVGGLGHILEVGGNFFDDIGRAHDIAVGVDDGLLVEDIDLALEVVLFAERDEDRAGVGTKFGAHGFHGGLEVRAGAIHFVHESDTRNAVFGGLAPDGFRLGLNAGHAAEHGHGTVQHAKGTLDLGREVHMARGVDDVDAHFDALESLVETLLLALHPGASGGGGGDRDATLALLLHPVGDRGALVHLADLVDHAGVEKNAFGGGRLAGVDMSGDADVACALQREGAVGGVRVRGVGRGCHGVLCFLKNRESGIKKRAVFPVGKKPPALENHATNGNARKRGWPAPSCACRRVF